MAQSFKKSTFFPAYRILTCRPQSVHPLRATIAAFFGLAPKGAKKTGGGWSPVHAFFAVNL
jgi:hypothetical protein